MSNSEVGKIGWIDMTVDDADGVRDFYKAVVGWETDDVSMGDYSDYVMKMPVAGTPGPTLRLTLRQDGPINCFGEASIVGQDGSRWDGNQANLCRCGESEIKPFCDGSHLTAGFKA